MQLSHPPVVHWRATHEPITLTPTELADFMAHAASCAPAECCGLLVDFGPEHGGRRYVAAINTRAHDEGAAQFELDDATWWACEDAGEILAVCHSHPHASANPSMADRLGCEASGLPWLILAWPSEHVVQVNPCGWSAPLVGREYTFGVLDCYTLVQDYYRRSLGITLPDFERRDKFWERGEHLYRDNLQAVGGVVVSAASEADLVPGDVLLMRVLSPDVDNHAAVWVGDGYMLHHPYGQLSRRERWDTPWQRRTTAVLRHRITLGLPWPLPISLPSEQAS